MSAPTAWSARAGRPVAGRRARAATRAGPGRGLVVLLLAVAANWLLWASAVPFGEAPDEPSHLEVAQFVAAHGRLPTFGPGADQYVRLDQVGIPIESHALAPPLPYLVDGLLIRWLIRKYKRLHRSHKRGRNFLVAIHRDYPRLFAHWRFGAQPNGWTTGAV